MLLLLERERERLVRHAPAALLARQADSSIAEALADVSSGHAGDVERTAAAGIEAALQAIA
jgi:hypothetical protein